MSYYSDYKEIWMVITLVDITETSDTKGSGKLRNQQRNFETLQQTIGMLTQPWSLGSPIVRKFEEMHRRLKDTGITFGKKHDFTEEIFKNLNVWVWSFGVEGAEVFGKNGKKLLQALDLIPVINNLDEQCDLNPSIFSTNNEDRNIIVFKD
jgi:hypothetical protein